MKAWIALPFAAGILGVVALTAVPSGAGARPVQDQGAQAFAACRACHTLPAGGKSVITQGLTGESKDVTAMSAATNAAVASARTTAAVYRCSHLGVARTTGASWA